MSQFVKFPSIEKFSDCVYLARKQGRKDVMQFASKIKLHGTNAAIRITSKGSVSFQKRTSDVRIESDNAGFAAWASTVEWIPTSFDMVINGEWAGPGINSKDAVTQLKEKRFFVFNIVNLNTNEILQNPEMITPFLPKCDRIHVLPIFSKFEMNLDSESQLNSVAGLLTSEVSKIGEEDPYIKDLFCISGPGEGLVGAPYSDTWMSDVEYRSYVFKVKTLAHTVQKNSKPASVKIEVPSNVTAFAEMFVTENRVDQIISINFPERVTMKDMGAFLKALSQDIIKESANELELTGLTWKDVNRAVTQKATKLFQSKT